MSNRIFNKCVERNTYLNQFTQKRRKDIYSISENIKNYPFTSFYNAAQNFYADPSVIIQDTNYKYNRSEAGNDQCEIYYDCLPYESEIYEQSPLQEQLQLYEVIYKIQDPKSFKSLLKYMAYTSNTLYRTFRRAYKGTKKRKQKTGKSVHSNKNCKSQMPSDQSGQGDMNPLVVNTKSTHIEQGDLNPMDANYVEISRNYQELLNDVQHSSPQRKEKRKKKPHSYDKCIEESKCSSNYCKTCPMCNGQICYSCMDSLDPETLRACDKTENSECANDTKNCEDETSSCVENLNLCKYEEELKNVKLCDRCAVLRGEMNLDTQSEAAP